MGSTILMLVAMTTVAMLCENAVTGLPMQCNPEIVEELPRMRKICLAISRIYELGSEIVSYINDKENRIPGYHEGIPLLDSGVKRQDVDHVFLRFG